LRRHLSVNESCDLPHAPFVRSVLRRWHPRRVRFRTPVSKITFVAQFLIVLNSSRAWLIAIVSKMTQNERCDLLKLPQRPASSRQLCSQQVTLFTIFPILSSPTSLRHLHHSQTKCWPPFPVATMQGLSSISKCPPMVSFVRRAFCPFPRHPAGRYGLPTDHPRYHSFSIIFPHFQTLPHRAHSPGPSPSGWLLFQPNRLISHKVRSPQHGRPGP
jgi:hypothetical protein